MARTVKSKKAKGRRLQQEARDKLLAACPHLEPDDIRSTSMGAGGEDLLLSPAARRVYPFSFEIKNQERFSIWAALEQAESHGDYPGAVIFSRNNAKTYIALELNALLDWMFLP